jgi:hypothetical protein
LDTSGNEYDTLSSNKEALASDEQLILDWFARAVALDSFGIVQPLSYDEAIRRTPCDYCHSTKAHKSCSRTGDVVCADCGALINGGRIISCDDGKLRSKREREPDDYELEHAEHAANANKDHARAKFQSYRRGYHFNERLAARQNHEPRIPLDALQLFDRTTRAILGLSDSESYRDRKAELTEALIKGVCRLYKYKKLDIHAERWLQIRYYFITGRTERKFINGFEYEHEDWDIPWLKSNEIRPLQRLFNDLSRCFDLLFYRPSARFTLKDHYVVASHHESARHNILQLDYMMQHIIFIVLGERRFHELRTQFCFPTSMRPATKAALDSMMSAMVDYYNENRPIEKRIKFTVL